MSLEDQSIRSTDNDASLSRESAVQQGYLVDPFSSYFATQQKEQSSRRPPLINVGTHLRTWSIDKLFHEFLSCSSTTEKKRQVVSIGAGSDTRAFRLFEKYKQQAQSQSQSQEQCSLKYLEIDFEQVTRQKVKTILLNERLRNLCVDIEDGDSASSETNLSSLQSSNYVLLPFDLRRAFAPVPPISTQSQSQTSTTSSFADLILSNIDPNVPTLLLAECVFVYMAPLQSQKLISWFADNLSEIGAITYEMTNPDDAFGRVMVRNLNARGLSLPGLAVNTTIQSQATRLKAAKFDHADVHSLLTVRQKFVPREELQRIAKLELLDEVEELNLMISHYAVAWAYKTKLALNESAFYSFKL